MRDPQALDAVVRYSHVSREDIRGPMTVDDIQLFWTRAPSDEHGLPNELGAGYFLYNPSTGKVASASSLPPRMAVARFRHLVE